MEKQRQRRVYSPLQRDLLSLLDHERGAYGEADLELPALRAHPAILMRERATGVKRFQEALIRLLKESVVLFRVPIEEALSIQFAFEQKWRDEDLKKRQLAAARAAGKSSYEAYSKDRDSKSLLSVTLDRLEERLNELASVEPAVSPGERPRSGRAPTGPHRVSVARGHVVIEDLISLAACDREQSAHQEMLLEFESDLRADRPAPVEWPLLRAQLLPALVREAEADGKEFRDELGLDLTYVRPQSQSNGGPRRYSVGVSQTSYHQWAATANSLGRDLRAWPDVVEQLGTQTLREAWEAHPTCLEDLARQTPPALIGICVVVIAEEQIILLERQGIHYVATRAEVNDKRRLGHFMGEGMTPADTNPLTGRYCPERGALRGCEEELGLTAQDIELTPTAIVLDTKRCQPLFCFLGDCSLPIADIEERMQFAPDRRETISRIVAQLPASSRDETTRSLLAGRHPEFVLSSNHADAALLYALFYLDGRTYVRDQLIKE
jgi:hypothetical protein